MLWIIVQPLRHVEPVGVRPVVAISLGWVFRGLHGRSCCVEGRLFVALFTRPFPVW